MNQNAETFNRFSVFNLRFFSRQISDRLPDCLAKGASGKFRNYCGVISIDDGLQKNGISPEDKAKRQDLLRGDPVTVQVVILAE